MKNTSNIREALTEMRYACESTRWELNFREREDEIYFCLRERTNAPEYTPTLYLTDGWGEHCDLLQIGVQTTSYGALNCFEIKAVADGLMEAAQLACSLGAIAKAHGIQVCPA